MRPSRRFAARRVARSVARPRSATSAACWDWRRSLRRSVGAPLGRRAPAARPGSCTLRPGGARQRGAQFGGVRCGERTLRARARQRVAQRGQRRSRAAAQARGLRARLARRALRSRARPALTLHALA